jgi:hypothetical protein
VRRRGALDWGETCGCVRSAPQCNGHVTCEARGRAGHVPTSRLHTQRLSLISTLRSVKCTEGLCTEALRGHAFARPPENGSVPEDGREAA